MCCGAHTAFPCVWSMRVVIYTHLTVPPQMRLLRRPLQPSNHQHAASFPPMAAMSYTFLTVTTFTMVLPTTTIYLERLGSSSHFAGLLVGLQPLFAAVCSTPLHAALWCLLRSVLHGGAADAAHLGPRLLNLPVQARDDVVWHRAMHFAGVFGSHSIRSYLSTTQRT